MQLFPKTKNALKTDLPVGALCFKDTKPRTLTTNEVSTLLAFAEEAENELNKKSLQ